MCIQEDQLTIADYGLSHDVVMELIQPLVFQGYEVYLVYSSPDIFDHLLECGITATGTFCANQRGLPTDVLVLKAALDQPHVSRRIFWNQIPQLCTLVGVISELSW